jgi:hypothetical protein
MTTEEIHVEADRISKLSLLVIIGSVLLVTLLSIWLAWVLLLREERSIGATARGVEKRPVHPEQISRVRQTLIYRDREGMRLRKHARQSLQRYEWIDRERGTVSIPIERAMELRAQGVHP